MSTGWHNCTGLRPLGLHARWRGPGCSVHTEGCLEFGSRKGVCPGICVGHICSLASFHSQRDDTVRFGDHSMHSLTTWDFKYSGMLGTPRHACLLLLNFPSCSQSPRAASPTSARGSVLLAQGWTVWLCLCHFPRPVPETGHDKVLFMWHTHVPLFHTGQRGFYPKGMARPL